MRRNLTAIFLFLIPLSSFAQPDIARLLALNLSMVQVSVELPNGRTGTGSGVVVSEQYVATNCHVLANALGVSVAKYGDGHQPVALKADWAHDLCLLKFDKLPFPPVPMRDSASLAYEEEVFVISYPNDTNVPQPSYGSIKALYPFDGSVIVRSDAAFSLGSSGGALYDQDSRLIGITTFKSPGRNAYYYSLPVEWIRQLMEAPELSQLTATEQPFWSLPETEHPWFMRVVMPYQNADWPLLKTLARGWQMAEPDNAEAWFYLGVAQKALDETTEAELSLKQAVKLNPRHLDAQLQLASLAMDAGDQQLAEQIINEVEIVSVEEAASLTQKIRKAKAVEMDKNP